MIGRRYRTLGVKLAALMLLVYLLVQLQGGEEESGREGRRDESEEYHMENHIDNNERDQVEKRKENKVTNTDANPLENHVEDPSENMLDNPMNKNVDNLKDDNVKVPVENPKVTLEEKPEPQNVVLPPVIEKHLNNPPAHKDEGREGEKADGAMVGAPPKMPEGPGEMGKPFVIDKEQQDNDTKAKIDLGWQNNAYNEYVSDRISVHRSLPDIRDDWCRAPDRLLSSLPTTAVIVCFHNEAWSVLLRTVHSILDRSPGHLLKEVLLVDDASTMSHLGEELEQYMAQYPRVKVVRARERLGLIRARLLGAEKASDGIKVLTFLDSHIECTPGWLEPLLDRIGRNSSTVVCPVIDIINTDTLEYVNNGYLAVGGFDWNLIFNWHETPQHENIRRGHSWAPMYSPTMAGGLFAIDREFFTRLGTYDSGFEIWGGENLELSFKTWMCGGTLEIVPCSHVGHIFRKRSPYKWGSKGNVVKRNSIRLAEVWLDDYSKYYYQRLGSEGLGEYGDVSERKALRAKLQCRSFRWYLDTVFPELFIPGDAVAQGEVRNPASSQCLDSAVAPDDMHKPVGTWPCHKQGGNQYWLLSKQGEVRRDEACFDNTGQDVILYPCHGSRGNQWWQYSHQLHRMKHATTRKCLAITGDKLSMEECVEGLARQEWVFQGYNSSLALPDV